MPGLTENLTKNIPRNIALHYWSFPFQKQKSFLAKLQKLGRFPQDFENSLMAIWLTYFSTDTLETD